MRTNQAWTRIAVNGAFRGQRITGQQRYASEIAYHLTQDERVRELKAAGWAQKSAAMGWGMAHTSGLTRRPDEWLLSLTMRSPLYAPRHAIVVFDLLVITHPEWFTRPFVLSHAPAQTFQIRTAQALVAISEPVADEVRERFGRDVTVVAPCGTSSTFTSRVEPELDAGVLDRVGVTDDRYLLAVGSLDPRKNQARLARAYASLPDDVREEYALVVVGAGGSAFAEQQIRWPSGTVLTGYLPDHDLAALYRHTRGVLMPSLAEGFGLPLVEALSSGARLAVSDIPVFRWVLGDQPAALCDPVEVESIASAITTLIGDDEGRFRPRADLRDRFSWRRSADLVKQALIGPG